MYYIDQPAAAGSDLCCRKFVLRLGSIFLIFVLLVSMLPSVSAEELDGAAGSGATPRTASAEKSKNLFDISILGEGVIFEDSRRVVSLSNSIITVSGKGYTGGIYEIGWSCPFFLLSKGTYTISFKSSFPFGQGNSGCTVEVLGFLGSSVLGSTGKSGSFTFTLNEDSQIRFRFDVNNDTMTADFYDIMLNEGDTPLPYVPFGYQESDDFIYLDSISDSFSVTGSVLNSISGNSFLLFLLVIGFLPLIVRIFVLLRRSAGSRRC